MIAELIDVHCSWLIRAHRMKTYGNGTRKQAFLLLRYSDSYLPVCFRFLFSDFNCWKVWRKQNNGDELKCKVFFFFYRTVCPNDHDPNFHLLDSRPPCQQFQRVSQGLFAHRQFQLLKIRWRQPQVSSLWRMFMAFVSLILILTHIFHFSRAAK